MILLIASEVFMRVEQDDARENRMVVIKLNLPGNQLFAKEKEFDATAEALKRQLESPKKKCLRNKISNQYQNCLSAVFLFVAFIL